MMQSLPSVNKRYKLTAKQTTAWNLLMSSEALKVCYGGAKGGGKSFLFCLWAYLYSQYLIKLFGIDKPLQHPLLVGFIGRQRATDFNKTTFETWKRIIPAEAYTIRTQEKEIVISNKVKLWYGGLDDRETISKFNGAELAFAGIDQAEETEKTDLGTLEASLRLTFNGIVPAYKCLYTANPAECHLKYRFVKSETREENCYFVPALWSDNEHLPVGYERTLEEAFAYDHKLLRAYKEGDWDILLPTNQLITMSMIEGLRERAYRPPVTKKLVACDPSMGGDVCAVKVFYGTKVVESVNLHERDTMKIAAELWLMGQKHSTKYFAVDGIGIGRGIVDKLAEMGGNVTDIQSAENADDVDHFVNRKAEMWAYVAQMMNDKKLEAIECEDTRKQLTAVKYKIVSGRLQIEPKEQTRKALGRSPDDADCYVYGIWTLSRINDNVREEIIDDDRQGRGERVLQNAESEYINIC